MTKREMIQAIAEDMRNNKHSEKEIRSYTNWFKRINKESVTEIYNNRFHI